MVVDAVGAVRRYYSLVDANDVAGIVDLFTDDAVYHRPGYEPLVGRQDLERFYREDRVIQAGAHRLTAIGLRPADRGGAGRVLGHAQGRARGGPPLRRLLRRDRRPPVQPAGHVLLHAVGVTRALMEFPMRS
jgi:ketosteroid isomerase-like protein